MTLPVATQRILQGTAATISVTLTDQDGEPKNAAGAVSVTVARWDGTLLAGLPSVQHAATGVYTVALTPAQTATLDHLTATWTDAGNGAVHTSTVAIVGGFYFSIAQARAQSGLEDSGKVPNTTLLAARREVEEELERIIGVAFVPRFRAVTVWGGGQDWLQLPDLHLRALRALKFGDVAMSADALTNTVITADGRIERYWPYLSNATDDSWGMWGQRFPNKTRVTVAYEHGLDRPYADLQKAALRRLRSVVSADKSGIPDRATTFTSTEGGTFSLATPGAGRWQTGVPDVDSVYFAYRDLLGRKDPTAGSIPIGTAASMPPAQPMI